MGDYILEPILCYKGYEGKVEFDTHTEAYYGKLIGISDLVTFQADTPNDVQKEFELAVDDYIETLENIKEK